MIYFLPMSVFIKTHKNKQTQQLDKPPSCSSVFWRKLLKLFFEINFIVY